jgi:uncharacterized protein
MSRPSPAVSVWSRLQVALRAAMQERDTVAMAALRSALGAIANAEAVPLGGAELDRRVLTEDEAAAIAAAQAADRRAAARDYEPAGDTDRAARLRREARAIESALDITPSRDDA